MSGFADLLLIQFGQAAFVTDFLVNKIGLDALFNTAYTAETVVPHNFSLASVQQTEFEMPAFETIRERGINERITPSSERMKIDRDHYRLGRLSWVDVYLDVLLASDVESQEMPIEKITSQELLTKLGAV